MKLRLESENGTYVHVALAGTVVEATPIDDPLDEFNVGDIYARGILLNMDEVKLLNSHGVGWLLRTHKLCAEAGGRLVIHSVPALAKNVLRMMRLTELLNLADNVQKGMAMLEAEA